jgi:hypothetical protein
MHLKSLNKYNRKKEYSLDMGAEAAVQWLSLLSLQPYETFGIHLPF